MDEELVGRVTHYFPRIGVAAVEVTNDELRLGDMIRVLGATSNFTQQIQSMEVEHASVEMAAAGNLVAIQVDERARPKDLVFRIRPHAEIDPGSDAEA